MSKSQPPDDQTKGEPAEQPEPKFSQEQYDMLLRCSKAKDITEWNNWRKDNPNTPVHLEGAQLGEVHLEGANLVKAHLKGAHFMYANLNGAKLYHAHLEGADLMGAHLEDTEFWETHLEGARLVGAYLKGAGIYHTHLEGAELCWAHLEGAEFIDAHLGGTRFAGARLEDASLVGANLAGVDFYRLKEFHFPAHLERADLSSANLDGADVSGAFLNGANLYGASLKGTRMRGAKISGSTVIWKCDIDRETDTTGVALANTCIEPGLKQLLEYNVRRKRWEERYKKQPWWMRTSIKLFWEMSDYGRSTRSIIVRFLLLTFYFALVYYAWGLVCQVSGESVEHGLVANLFVDSQGAALPCWVVPFRAAYFSVVTMTTLGFGDMHANDHSVPGHILLTIQVLLGYIMLGALITRFAVLFTAGGPAAKFPDEQK